MENNLSTGDKKNKSNKVENFAELLEESFSKEVKKVGSLVSGKVVAIEKEAAVVDIGFKSEGRVPLKEFTPPDKKPNVGDMVEVFLNKQKINLETPFYQEKELNVRQHGP